MDITSTLFLGVDIGMDNNQACLVNFNQDIFFNCSFENSLNGSRELMDKISSVFSSSQYKYLQVCMESTSLYFCHLANLLSTDEKLSAFYPEVYCINPKQIAGYKKSFIDRPKNDPSDAWLIADFIRIGRCKSLNVWKGASYVALQRLTRYRFHLAHNLSAEKAYCLNNIYLKCSKLRKKSGPSDDINPFSDLFGASASAVLTEFMTPDDVINKPMEELVAFLDEKSRSHFSDTENIAKMLRNCMNNSYRLDKISYDAINITIASNLRMISMLEKELKNLDKQIDSFIKGIYQNEMTVLTSVPGIGTVFAAGIIAEIGSIAFFKNQAALARYAGLSWSDNSSAKKISENNRLIASGNKFLKYYLQEAANLVRINDFSFRSYYSMKYSESKTHKHKRALVLTTRKLVRVVYRLLRDNTLYVNRESGEVTW